MSLCTYYLQTSEFLNAIAKLNISTTTSHVSSNCHCTHLTCIGNNLSLKLMEFGIKNFMWNTFLLKLFAKVFRCVNIYRAYKYRLSFFVCRYYISNNSIELFFLCLINSIFIIDTSYRKICRNLNNIHLIDVTEFFFLCKSCTCHT